MHKHIYIHIYTHTSGFDPVRTMVVSWGRGEHALLSLCYVQVPSKTSLNFKIQALFERVQQKPRFCFRHSKKHNNAPNLTARH